MVTTRVQVSRGQGKPETIVKIMDIRLKIYGVRYVYKYIYMLGLRVLMDFFLQKRHTFNFTIKLSLL